MRPFAIRALLWKELRQVGRNRTALLTAAILPFIILFVAPIQLLLQFRLAGGLLPEDVPFPGIDMSDPDQLLLQLIYPVLFVLGGLLLPSITTTYAIVLERERGSLELLVALPVSVTEILSAKLLMVLVVTALAGVPYLAIVFALLITLGIADASVVPALLSPFVAAVICSTALSLVLTLLARDFRTANNLDAVLFVPLLAVTVAILGLVSGPARTYVLCAVLLVIAAAAVIVAMRWITFERYLD